MKKEFIIPQMEIAVFANQNILTASGDVKPEVNAMDMVKQEISETQFAATVDAIRFTY